MSISLPPYCPSLTAYVRRATIPVRIGDLEMGSHVPIRIQSMTTTNTMDTEATIAQSIRMIEAGCELVRITAPSIREAKNLEFIRSGLRERGFTAPLVADIHYTPNAAEVAARIVEKVRINPGNYVDKKQFAVLEYTDEEYLSELQRIRDKFVPLVRICKEYGTAMRIGTNHGSLSDRIMSRYGDSPSGMVESALEFLRIANDEGFHNIVLSMKSSNPLVMVAAYRLLVSRLQAEGLPAYPLHLGVTEAGDGEDGRVKSAVGIGTLLEDGLGDTVRVSLTEEPEAELPVARALVQRYEERRQPLRRSVPAVLPYSPTSYRRRTTHSVATFGGDFAPRVIADLSRSPVTGMGQLEACGHIYDAETDKWTSTDQAADYLYVGSSPLPFMAPGGTRQIVDARVWATLEDPFYSIPLFTVDEFLQAEQRHGVINVIRARTDELTSESIARIRCEDNVVLWLNSDQQHGMADIRATIIALMQEGCEHPVVVERLYDGTHAEDEITLWAATDIGGLLVDGMGDAIVLRGLESLSDAIRLSFGILQAARTRMTKTEYISCPSCGRTLFDLQETTALIRKHTDHLKGIKIGIMGCIVNGPGEMADADYGYVGSGPERITLYRGQEIVRRNIPTANALDELITIMKEDGAWIDR